jgi:superfamily I DNA/RNA helicase
MADRPHFKDSPADLVLPKQPQRAAGAKPTLVRCDSPEAEAALVAQYAADLGRSARVAVLTRTRAESRAATRGITALRTLHDQMRSWDISNGVYNGTYHSAKGLEFDVVFLPFCGADRTPDKDTVAAFGPDEAASRESRLLYVGVTRAKSELLITYSGELTPLMPPSTSDLYVVTS